MARPVEVAGKPLTINLPAELTQKIREHAAREGVSLSEAARRILYRYFAFHSNGEDRLVEVRERLAELERERARLEERLREVEAESSALREEERRLLVFDERWESFKSGEYVDVARFLVDGVWRVLMSRGLKLRDVSRKVLGGLVDSDAQLVARCQELFGRKPSQCLEVVWDFEKGGLKDGFKG